LSPVKVKERLKVLQIVGALGMGGAETWLLELLRFWNKQGSAPQIDFLLTSGERGIFDDEARRLGAELYYVRYGRAYLIPFLTEFRRILSRGNYDAIHDHSDFASGWHFLLGDVLPPVRVTHVHTTLHGLKVNYSVTLSRRIATLIGRRLVRSFATHVCGTSEQVLEEYGFALKSKNSARPIVTAAYCGIDVHKFNFPREHDRASVLSEFGWPEDSKIVLFAGRLDSGTNYIDPRNQKNSWLALNVARCAVQKHPSLRLLMAGAGSHSRERLQKHIELWGMTDRLRVIGVRNDIDRLMRAADLLLFPSSHEGLGMVAVEAQAAGLPILASSGVPRECIVIPELFNALPLSEPVETWVAAMIEILKRQRPTLEVCRRALEASPFSIERSARRLEEIYGSTLQ
jgi:glycosyltransferase EpsF